VLGDTSTSAVFDVESGVDQNNMMKPGLNLLAGSSRMNYITYATGIVGHFGAVGILQTGIDIQNHAVTTGARLFDAKAQPI
jgi:hypothetical protein